jgi:hypothetical protein
MEAGKSLQTLYKIFEQKFGPSEARLSVMASVGNIIGRLQDENLPVTEEAINSGLEQAADDFVQATKSDVA